MEEAANAGYVVILDKGSIVAEGTPFELKSTYVQDTVSIYGVTEDEMKAVISLMNRKLFFRDKGMFLSSLITPIILIVLYVTFLAKVYKDSFTSAFPEGFMIAEKLIDGTVASQLVAAILAVSCVTVTFCVNLTMVQDLSLIHISEPTRPY